jgi:16S rRNA (uracil1498-N3)-methyltransferase
MRRILCGTLPRKASAFVEIPEAEAKHLISVLRLGPGDEVEVLDGEGYCATAKLDFRGQKKVFAELLNAPVSHPERLSLPIHLHMSIIKGDAMEWVIEKAVELGVRSITPVETEFTVVKIQKRGADTFQDRWQRIADQALKQCGRLDRMIVHLPVDFETALLNQNRFIWLDETLASTAPSEAHLATFAQKIPKDQELSLLVGPEGGLSPTERNRLLQLTGSEKKEINRVHLGSLILRAETAALAGISILMGNDYAKRKN